MANFTNHHRKAIGKVWDTRPVTEVPREELSIVPAPPRPKEDWQYCKVHGAWYWYECPFCVGKVIRRGG